MRITNQMMYQVAQAQTMAARDRAVDAQNQVATGVRVVHPGDDPAAAGIMVTQNVAVQRLDVIDQSISREGLDATLTKVADIFGNEKAIDVHAIGASSFWTSRMKRVNLTLEYQFPHRWVVAAIIKL